MEYTQHGEVVEIRLDDGKVNAMGPAFFDGLNALLDRVEREKPGALVLAGREGFFSPGLDLKLLPTLQPDDLTRTLQSFGYTLLRVWTLGVPTVAAITGHAVAGGLFLALACDRRVMARTILPNCLSPLVVQFSLGVGYAMLVEAGLSFLGLGVQPPTPAWGQMVGLARNFITLAPWLITFHGLAIFLAVLAFNFLGDGLREATDPRLRGRRLAATKGRGT